MLFSVKTHPRTPLLAHCITHTVYHTHYVSPTHPPQEQLPTSLLKLSTENTGRAIKMFNAILKFQSDVIEMPERLELVQKLLHQVLLLQILCGITLLHMHTHTHTFIVSSHTNTCHHIHTLVIIQTKRRKPTNMQTHTNIHPLYTQSHPNNTNNPLHTQGLKRSELRDELYMQLLKQTRGNPNNAARLHGWELLYLVASTMAPSKDFVGLVSQYIHDTAHDPSMGGWCGWVVWGGLCVGG